MKDAEEDLTLRDWGRLFQRAVADDRKERAPKRDVACSLALSLIKRPACIDTFSSSTCFCRSPYPPYRTISSLQYFASKRSTFIVNYQRSNWHWSSVSLTEIKKRVLFSHTSICHNHGVVLNNRGMDVSPAFFDSKADTCIFSQTSICYNHRGSVVLNNRGMFRQPRWKPSGYLFFSLRLPSVITMGVVLNNTWLPLTCLPYPPADHTAKSGCPATVGRLLHCFNDDDDDDDDFFSFGA